MHRRGVQLMDCCYSKRDWILTTRQWLLLASESCLPACRLQQPPIRGRGGHEPNEACFPIPARGCDDDIHTIQGEDDASGYWLAYYHANRSSM
jgi:hypothetical protein